MGSHLLFLWMVNRANNKTMMKVFLTEVMMHGITYAGPNIVADSLDRALQAADENGLILTGEIDSIVVDPHGNSTYTEISLNATIH